MSTGSYLKLDISAIETKTITERKKELNKNLIKILIASILAVTLVFASVTTVSADKPQREGAITDIHLDGNQIMCTYEWQDFGAWGVHYYVDNLDSSTVGFVSNFDDYFETGRTTTGSRTRSAGPTSEGPGTYIVIVRPIGKNGHIIKWGYASAEIEVP